VSSTKNSYKSTIYCIYSYTSCDKQKDYKSNIKDLFYVK
jgi:hypothetical protein